MATFTWILLMLFAQQTYCHSTGKHKLHHHKNAKKSFLADAMKEMEYGENAAATTKESIQNNTKAVAPQEDKTHSNKQRQKHTNKKVVNQDQFVARIFPSKVITDVSEKEPDKANKNKEHGDVTPKLGKVHSKLLSTGNDHEILKNKGSFKSDAKVVQDTESLFQNSSTSSIISPSSSLQQVVVSSTPIPTDNTIASSNNSNSASEEIDMRTNNQGRQKKEPRKNIKDTIRLLQAFVEKLLKENETNESNQSSKPKPTKKQSEKKDVLKQALPIHVHPDDGQQSTVIAGVKYNLAPIYKIKAKYSKDAVNASNSSNSNPAQQQEQEQQQKQQNQEQHQPKIPSEQQQQQQENQKQQQEAEPQQQQQQNNTQNKLQENIEKLKQEENLLRQSLAEKELEIQKLKLQNPPSDNSSASNQVVDTTTQTPNITNENMKQDESHSNDDQKEMKFASLKGVPPDLLMKLKTILEEKRGKSQNIVSKQEVHSRKAFETARKLVKAALAREQLFRAEEDFFEKVKEMMNKTSTENLVNENADAQKESNVNNEEGSIGDYIRQIEEQSRLEAKVRRTSPSPLQGIASNTTTQSLNDSITAKAGPQGRNSSQDAASLDLQASAARILKQLNRTKGPDEKNVDAAAHLEEKVAEQQDEMYEKLIRQTFGKGMGGDDEDDEDDDEEEGVTRNMRTEYRPEEEMGRQENYGDFQDTDEDAQSRSNIKYVKQFNQNESLPTIEEDSLLSLRDKISRPPKQVYP
uniref:Transcription factor SPT20 homolog n=1 Tax=Actinia tenebrosa TaxID=6105 RepID=A0A6P8HP74_ACTTE